MNPDHLILSGIKRPEELEGYFAAYMVDVAYAEALTDGRLRIEVEDSTNLRTTKDAEWILDAVKYALKENNEDTYRIDFVFVEPTA